MPITLTAAVQAELAKAAINMIEMVRWDLGNGIVKYLANYPIDSSISFDGRTYEARVAKGGIPKLDFPIGRDSAKSKIKIRFANTDDYFDDLRDNQGVVFRGSKLSIVRLFPTLAAPNNRIGDWGPDDTSGAPNTDGPFWFGRCLNAVPMDDVCEAEFRFGFFGIGQRAYRTIKSSCYKVLGGPGCPYAPLSGRGHPQSTSTGTSTGITASTLTDTGATFVTDGIVADDLVLAYQDGDLTKFAIGTVQSRTETVLTIDAWSFQTPSSGWKYIAGPAHTDCNRFFQDCIARGMYGYKAFNKVQRRFFGGVGPIAQTSFEVVNKGNPGPDRYNTTPQGNSGVDGTVIPVPVGRVTLRKLPIIAAGADRDFVYSLIIFGEGRLKNVVTGDGVLLDGVHPDDHDFAHNDPVHRDPQQYGGFESMGGADDAGGVSGSEITEDERREAIGSRETYALSTRTIQDSYVGTGEPAGIPYLFADRNGLGPSFDGLAWMYLRTEPSGGAQGKLFGEAAAALNGIALRTIGNGGWTHTPSVAIFAWNLAQNKKWGGKADPALLHEDSFQDFHDHEVSGSVLGAAPVVSTLNVTVLFGPIDTFSDVHPDRGNWVFIDYDQLAGVNPFDYLGGELEVTEAGKTGTYTIDDVWIEGELGDDFINPNLGGPWENDPGSIPGVAGAFFIISEDWPSGKIPESTDTITLRQFASPQVHTAAGNPAKHVDIHEAMSDILDNMLGDHYQKGGQLHIALRKQGNLTAINALPTITDVGSSRNVLRVGGKTTAKWHPTDPEKLPNEVHFSFLDRAFNFERKTYILKNQEAQKIYIDRYGEDALDEAVAKLDLNLTTWIEDAIKIAALWLRHYGARPTYVENGHITVDMPIHDAIDLRPIEDIRPLALSHIPSWITYGRVESLTESVYGGFMTVKFIPYVHSDYTDPVNGLTIEYPESGPLADILLPQQVRPESVTETLVLDPQTKEPQTILDVEYTLPGEDR